MGRGFGQAAMGTLGSAGRDSASRGEEIGCGAGMSHFPAEAQFSFRALDYDAGCGSGAAGR